MTEKTKKISSRTDSDRLDEVIKLLRLGIALDMFRMEITQKQIAKNLGIAKVSVNGMLKGIQKTKQ